MAKDITFQFTDTKQTSANYIRPPIHEQTFVPQKF